MLLAPWPRSTRISSMLVLARRSLVAKVCLQSCHRKFVMAAALRHFSNHRCEYNSRPLGFLMTGPVPCRRTLEQDLERVDGYLIERHSVPGATLRTWECDHFPVEVHRFPGQPCHRLAAGPVFRCERCHQHSDTAFSVTTEGCPQYGSKAPPQSIAAGALRCQQCAAQWRPAGISPPKPVAFNRRDYRIAQENRYGRFG